MTKPLEVDIFIPCFIDQVYPETGFNMIKILEKAGVKVHYNTNQTCCGQMAFNAGFWDESVNRLKGLYQGVGYNQFRSEGEVWKKCSPPPPQGNFWNSPRHQAKWVLIC